jgi:hypothetical protein
VPPQLLVQPKVLLVALVLVLLLVGVLQQTRS